MLKIDATTITKICLLITIGLLLYLIQLLQSQNEAFDQISGQGSNACSNNSSTFCNTTAPIKCASKGGVHSCSCTNCTQKVGNVFTSQCNYTCNRQ